MPPRRKKHKHLPPCVHYKHGAYYLVKNNKWRRIGSTLNAALAEYARIYDRPTDTMGELLDRFMADVVARGVAPSTRQQYEAATRKLKSVLVEFRPDQMRPYHIAQIMDAWRATPNMANRCLTVLRQTFALAVRAGMIDSNPCADIKPHREKKRDRYITDAEYAAIQGTANPALRAIMDLCYLTGQRITDVLAIRESDLTDEGIVFQPKKTRHSTQKKLCVEWTPVLRQAVQRARDLHRVRRMLLLSYSNGKRRTYNSTRKLWSSACARAGVAGATLHDLRAKALTDAKKQGFDAQALAAHSTEQQTTTYLRGKEIEVVRGPSGVTS